MFQILSRCTTLQCAFISIVKSLIGRLGRVPQREMTIKVTGMIELIGVDLFSRDKACETDRIGLQKYYVDIYNYKRATSAFKNGCILHGGGEISSHTATLGVFAMLSCISSWHT